MHTTNGDQEETQLGELCFPFRTQPFLVIICVPRTLRNCDFHPKTGREHPREMERFNEYPRNLGSASFAALE